jgi:hypothetical protein
LSPENYIGICRRLDAIKEDVDELKVLAKETNGRIKELEIWRARAQGVMGTARILWLVLGGAVTALVIETFRSM